MTPKPNNQSLTPIHVAVAVIEDARGRILLSRRAPDAHQGGLWEFPGGKVEETEPFSQALARELLEELGIQLLRHEPLIKISHDYGDKSVVLDVHRVTNYAGIPQGREGQPLAWVTPAELHNYPMPAADRPIVAAIVLPDTYLITGDWAGDSRQLLDRLDGALARGERLFQLRLPGADEAHFRTLAGCALERCRPCGARLLLNAEPGLVADLGADGVHLNSRRLMSCDARPLGDAFLVAVSCHDEIELRHAEQIGADCVVISPVLPTRSHQGAKTLGWTGFKQLAESAAVPVYALGGMSPDLVGATRRQGGQGVAGISAFW